MNLAIAPPVSRFAAVLLLMIIVFAVWVTLVDPLMATVRHASSDLSATVEQLSGYRQRAAGKAGLEMTLVDLRQQMDRSVGVLVGDSPTLIAAKLQGDLTRMVTARRGTVSSVLTMSPADATTFTRIGVQVDFSIPATALVQLLYDIEAAVPFLFVENLSVRAADAPNVASDTVREPTLTVRAEIQGYARKPKQ